MHNGQENQNICTSSDDFYMKTPIKAISKPCLKTMTKQAEPDLSTQWYYRLALVGNWLQQSGTQLLKHTEQLE